MSIRMIGDRAVKIETSNSGCPFSQNALQLLYHPERLDSPLKRTGKKGTAKASAFETRLLGRGDHGRREAHEQD